MEVFLAALRHDADLSTRCAAILGVVVRGQNLHLLNRVHIGNADGRTVGSRPNGNRAVKRDQVVLSARSVDVQTARRQSETELRQSAARVNARLQQCQE
jgi:hypothetical protein